MTKIYLIIFTLLLISTYTISFAQSVGIDSHTPNTSNVLDNQSTTQGMLIPRMTSAHRTLISNPATGLLIFDTTTEGFWLYDGTTWVDLSTQMTGADGDTKLQLEDNKDDDKFRLNAQSEGQVVLKSDGTLQVDGHILGQRFAFSAYSSTGVFCSNGNKTLIPFNDITDPFNVFDPSTELFTAPRDGLYFFTTTLSFYTQNGNPFSSYYVNWRINGTGSLGIITTNGRVDSESTSQFPTKNTEASCTNSVVLDLNAGDTVGVEVDMNDANGASCTRACFCGFYLGG